MRDIFKEEYGGYDRAGLFRDEIPKTMQRRYSRTGKRRASKCKVSVDLSSPRSARLSKHFDFNDHARICHLDLVADWVVPILSGFAIGGGFFFVF